jgi:hypothetical protein
MSGRDFWTQITQNTRSTQINICVFCVPYSVTKVLDIFEDNDISYECPLANETD